MNRLLSTTLVILFGLTLAGCQTWFTQNNNVAQNTIEATVDEPSESGEAESNNSMAGMNAEAIKAAPLGGDVSLQMDAEDRMQLSRALERNTLGQIASWQNQRTQVSFKVTPMRNVTVAGNPYCREYTTVAEINGKSQSSTGTACRQSGGTWKAI